MSHVDLMDAVLATQELASENIRTASLIATSHREQIGRSVALIDRSWALLYTKVWTVNKRPPLP
jgi:uncharacterized protein YbjT (DUF2867 family)